MSKLNSSLYEAPTDQYGKKIEYDVREDDDKPKKLQEILELLVAAGYFRARIKGLSEFDKIVGGLTWCITTCNYDVDVDLLFQENLNIGLKIALTERIVSVLPRMKCPFAIEPHQIQGLDYVHIFPVIQWLVKRAIETRAEMGDMNRAFALSLFEKYNPLEKNIVELKTVNYLKEINAPQRKYVRKDAYKINDKGVRIQSTLLEYGQKTYLTRASTEAINQSSSSKPSASLKQAQEQHEQQLNAAKQAEEEHLKKLINGMASSEQKTRLNASVVGQIIGLKQDELQEIVSFYTNKDNELQQELDQIDKLGESSGFGGAHKQRLINVLNKQIEQKEKVNEEKKNEMEKLTAEFEKTKGNFDELRNIGDEKRKEIKNLEDLCNNADTRVVKKLEDYVAIYDTQKVKENEYKKKCKDELALLKTEVENMKKINENLISSEESDKYRNVIEQYDNIKSKMHAIRLKLAKKNREISLLQRKLDEIPSRVELSQYQKRFIELYNQISAVHTQTKQFFIMYNGLEDKKVYMNKEISLLNSINGQFTRAMSSQNTREQFLKQLELIIEGIIQSLQKTENRKTEQKFKRDSLNDKYIDLIDKKRLYFKTVKDFQEECKKNEILLAKLQTNQ